MKKKRIRNRGLKKLDEPLLLGLDDLQLFLNKLRVRLKRQRKGLEESECQVRHTWQRLKEVAGGLNELGDHFCMDEVSR